jgi:hypothetical protein
MDPNKRIARIAGVLFITATVLSVLSAAVLTPIVGASDYLIKVAANEHQVLLGALLQFIAAAACAGIAISLYPVLRRHNEGLALGSVGFRLMEGMVYVVGVISLLLLVPVSQDFVKAGAPDASAFQALGGALRAGPDWVGQVAALLAFGLGALMYYSVFYQSGLIPRWISGWGLAGATLTIVSSVILLFRLIDPMSTIQVVLNLPIAVQEMVLAVWLIVRGFSPSALASASAESDGSPDRVVHESGWPAARSVS